MAGRQRIDRVRRQYNQWVANQTLEDYALRFTAKSARRWSAARVANTALGAISFLALEAIGGTITLNYGVTNATAAILVVSVIIFCCGLPIAYHAAKCGIDIDLLTRGAGFGYIGSTITSLIYASFTFIFFAIEAVDSRDRAGAVLRHSASDRLSHQRRRHHSAGHPRHHADQPLPALDAAALDHPSHPALRGDRLRQSALVRGLAEFSRRARQPLGPSRSPAVRHRRVGGVLAGGADRRAGRLPALSAARPADLEDLVVDRAALRRPRLDHSRFAQTARRIVPGLFRAEPRRQLRACRRARAHVSRSVPLRAVAAGSRAGADRHLRHPVAAEDQRHQRLCRLDRLVELLFPPDPQPSRPRGLAGVQRGGGAAADGDRRLQGARTDARRSIPTSRSPGSARWSPTSSSTSRSACGRSTSSSSARISTTSIRSASAP